MDKIPRSEVQSRILEALKAESAVVLLGPRQVGKSTLARQIAEHQVAEVAILDLERPSDLRKLNDAEALLSARIGTLTVIDEVHRVPELFATLRWLIDEARQRGHMAGQFLLLGSASLDLIQQASESLAGRVSFIELAPINPTEASSAGITQDELWLRGGFPRGLLAADDAASLMWRQNFLRSYIERDVPMFAPRMPGALIATLLTMLANGQGTLLNASRLGAGLGVQGAAVNRYLDLLSNLLLVRRLPPWSANIGKRLVRSLKVYVRDSGLVHALLEIATLDQLLGHPVCGLSWEGFVIESLINAVGSRARPYFYATAQGAEIDLVFELAGKPTIAIEIKRSSAAHYGKGFLMACEDLAISNRMVVHSGTDSYPMRHGIQAHSLSSAIKAVREATADPFGRFF